MLYDPKWETQTNYTFASLVAWLEKKPAAEKYNWHDVHGCLLCQYLQEVCGIKNPAEEVAGGFGPSTIKDWPPGSYYNIAGRAPYTFGAALKRARAVA